MQDTPLDPLAARLRPGAWLGTGAVGAGALVAAAGLGAPIDATPAGLALTALGVVAIGGSAALAWRSRALGALPLELGPRTVRGDVDGLRTWRFRVRLGRGRPFTDPVAAVVFEGPDGPVALPTRVPPVPTALGPLTVLAVDPARRCGPPGVFRVTVTVRAEGREWRAEGRIPATTAEGWFGRGFDEARTPAGMLG